MEIQKNHNGILSQLKPIHLVLLVAFLLRIPYVFFTSYTHDELSALIRLDFNSISELISKGVLIDYHPPLVQVFLYYYCKLFGTAEWLVKLPFALCGLASVWLIYKTGKKYINEYAGVLTAAVLAVTQLYIYHSNVARPYAPGLLFTLLFLHYFLKLVIDDDKKLKTKILYITFAFCAAATHYFAGLTVGVLGLSGIILLKRHQIIPYFVTNAVILISFIPLYLIMKNQLSHGGLGGWLGAPEKGYAFKFIRYVFHYDWIFLGFFLVGCALAFLQLFRKRELTRISLHIVFICSFAIIYATAILYSKYKTPIMQFSILQFALPFLLLSIFSIFQALPKLLLNTFVLIFLSFGTYSLYVTRANHEMMMDYPYKSFAAFCEPVKQKYPNEKILVVTSDRPEFVSRYLKANGNFEIFSIYNIEKPYELLWNKIREYNPSRIIAGNLDFNTYSMLKSLFGSCGTFKEGFLNEFYVFCKNTVYNVSPANYQTRYIGKNLNVQMDSVTQFYNLIDSPLVKLNLGNQLQFQFSANIQSIEKNPLVLVFEMNEGNNRVLWYGGEIFTQPDSVNYHATYSTFDFHAELAKHKPDDIRIKMYLWNPRLVKTKLKDFGLYFSKPNYKLYGMTEDFNR